MIWIIGGTKDSRDFIELLIKNGMKDKIIVTTATEYGGRLLENLDILVHSKRLTLEDMERFVQENKIKTVIDLSHPYAVEVSKNAINCSKKTSIQYIRYERKEIENSYKKSKIFTTIQEIKNYLDGKSGNILVTLGSNNIEYFRDIKDLDRYYFRILPKWEMVKKVEEIGILPKNIIAVQGPFSKNMNIATIDEYNIKYLITKKSGNSGGELEKLEACREKNIEIIYLDREDIEYPQCCNSFEDILKLFM